MKTDKVETVFLGGLDVLFVIFGQRQVHQVGVIMGFAPADEAPGVKIFVVDQQVAAAHADGAHAEPDAFHELAAGLDVQGAKTRVLHAPEPAVLDARVKFDRRAGFAARKALDRNLVFKKNRGAFEIFRRSEAYPGDRAGDVRHNEQIFQNIHA